MAGNNGSNGSGRTGLRVVGKPHRKVDVTAKCTGETKYADDIVFPRMLHTKLFRSSVPHARILKIDTSKAESYPGVKAVLTGNDLPAAYGAMPVSEDEHALAIGKVRMVGEPVAAIAAVDEDVATEALDLIEVEYELLPTISSIESALEHPEPRVHDHGEFGNIHRRQVYEFGDVEVGFAEADFIREDLTFYEGSTHLALEQHASVANFSKDGKLTLYTCTQDLHYLHKALVKVLGLPASHIHVIATPNGGGFGGKCDPFQHEMVVSKLAMVTGRPVKICLTREEVFYCHRGRHPALMSTKTGFKKDGSITAMHHRTILDGGAYGGLGIASAFYTGTFQTTTYTMPRFKCEAVRVFTNKAPCGPKRGNGTPQPRFAQEVQMDKIAEQLGLDPAEMRKRHLVAPDSTVANWIRVGSMALGKCIDKVVEGSHWKERFRRLPYGKGIGMACSGYMTGAQTPIYWNNMPHSGVHVQLDRGGGVSVFCGSAEIGQGSDSILAYIVAEVLGIDPFDIRVVTADTDLTPVDLGSYSSRVTLMTGNAAIQAAERAKDLLSQAVAEKLEVPGSRLSFADRRVFDSENPEKGVTFIEAVWLAETKFGTLGTVGSYKPPAGKGKFKGSGIGPSPAFSFTAAIAEVEVNPETGIVVVPRMWIAHDVGQCINPVLVMGQVEGSVYMGLGEALMEEMTYRGNRNVVHKFPSFLEYKSPTTLEMCDITTYLIEDGDSNGPFGAKEAGQGPQLPVPPAIANAIYDAVGVRIDEVPITPDKVLKAIRAKAKGQEGRYGPAKFTYPTEMPAPIYVPSPIEGGDGKPLQREPAVAQR
ncbi:MAG TPA: xanthine dehydrogenase family protein molybdopterin-binding subunit [Bryobacteraceae bacterium]|nr:xanthine dehydrogenase family protein molybdopterin-binding subunit [Bryobacteraceae bacterium]